MKHKIFTLVLTALVAALVGCGQKADSAKTATLGKPMTDEPIQPINAANLRDAHRRLEQGTSIGKIVLAGF